MAHSGDPIFAEELLFKPVHSIIDQSLHSRMGATTTNGDGFGIGWYGEGHTEPAFFKSIDPAWNDANLREVAGRIRTRCCSPTSVPRPGPRCSAPTAIRSGTAGGCGCTTGPSGNSRRSNAT
jgi:glutamine amidotransferase